MKPGTFPISYKNLSDIAYSFGSSSYSNTLYTSDSVGNIFINEFNTLSVDTSVLHANNESVNIE